jgi:CubicO group peptidase (beta-lactamase class C family)
MARIGRRRLLRLALVGGAIAAATGCSGAPPPTPPPPTPAPATPPPAPPPSPTAQPVAPPAASATSAPVGVVPGNRASDRLFPGLVAFVESEMARLRIPGVAVGVLDGGVEYTAGRGVTNVDHPLPVDADTLFQVGSITKTYTATAAMRLVDEGRLDVDKPVRTYLPDLRLAHEPTAAALTLRHLLTHTGGFVGDYFADTGRGDDALARYAGEMAGLEQLTPAGETYSYCNSGFSLLGRVIEAVTGQSFEAAIKRLVLEPMGLRRSFLFPEEVMPHRFAVGHRVQGGRATVLQPWQLPRAATPAGGLVASVRDQLRYARLQLGDGSTPDGARLLAPGTLGEMRSPRLASWLSIGLAWNVARDTVWHGGGTYGQLTLLHVDLGRRLALSVLTNAGNGAELNQSAFNWVYERYVGITFPRPTPLAYPTEMLDRHVGHYAGALTDLEVSRDDDALLLRVIPKGGFPTRDTPPPGTAPPPIRMGLVSGERLVGLSPGVLQPNAQVLRVGGEIAWIRYNGRIHRRAGYTPRLEPGAPAAREVSPTNVAGRSDTSGISPGAVLPPPSATRADGG